MNEFIIWDERYRVFRKLLKIDFELGLYFCIDKVVPFEKGVLVKNIGLKDINGKSIYADCSIFEFFDHKQDYFKGYFTFNIKKLAYEIIIFGLNEDFIDIITYCKDDITNLEIIDTIQENKLGLIKA